VAREWLVRIREERKMSQGDVAEQSGIVQQSYQQIESGKNRPRIETARRIAKTLGFDWTRFYEDSGEEQEDG